MRVARNHGPAAAVAPPSSSSWLVTLVALSVAASVVVRLSDWRTARAGASEALPVTTYEGGYDYDYSDPRLHRGDESSSFFAGAQPTSVLAAPPRSSSWRLLLQDARSTAASSTPQGTIDDDITRDDVCSDYLTNFLNGTTDSKDICQAMYKAWQVADCKDHLGTNSVGVGIDIGLEISLQRSNHSGGGANNQSANDDVLIDDAFEKWECCGSIGEYYGRRCQQQSPLDAYKLLGIVVVLIICGGVKSLLRIANVQWIPDAGACIVVGALVGGVLRLAQTNLGDKILAFNNDLFLQIMLPPIVFEAALSIEKRAFRRDLFPILTFAVVGTFMSALAIAWITFHLSNVRGSGLPWMDSLLFGSLMSSIDPVATLGILSTVGVNQGDTLYTLIFGESLLNDGVSIVLFESFLRYMGDGDVVSRATIQDTLYHFVLVTVVSVATGTLCGALATLYFYALQGKQKAVGEVAMFCAWALVPYWLADGLGFSGIIAIMVMGFMMDYYVFGGHQSDEGEWMEYMEMSHDQDSTFPHPVEPCFGRIKATCMKAFSGRGLISSRSRHHVGFVASVLSTIMETSIFSYLGLFLFNDHVWDFGMTTSGLLACVTSRAGVVILLSIVINVCVWMDLEGVLSRAVRYCSNRGSSENDDDSSNSGTRVYLDVKTQMILFSAGVRGAVSYALVQNIPVYDAVTKHGSHYKGELRSMTSATIVILLFTFGALTYFTVRRDLSPQRERVAGPLTHRLLSTALDSFDGEDAAESDINSTFEIDGLPNQRRDRGHEPL